MPDLARITATFFVNLINRLGVRPPPADGFVLSNTVVPISIVDTDISLPAVLTPPIYGTPSSAGEQIAPAANTVLADTGQLAQGTYQFTAILSWADGPAAVQAVDLQHRNAANAANIWDQNFYTTSSGGVQTFTFNWTEFVSLNERIRAICITAGSAGTRYHANIWALKIS